MPAHSPQTESKQLDVRHYLTLLRLQLIPCCLIVLVCGMAATIVSYSLPKRFQASSTVSIEQNVISDLVKGIAITPSVDSKLRLLRVHLLSRALLLKVASSLDMDLNAVTPAQKEALVDSLRSRIVVQHDEKKGLFIISYLDSDPYRARDFVNTITRMYIEENTAAKRQESYDATAFLAEQIAEYQKRIEDAQNAIDDFKSQKGMYLGLNEQILRQQIKEKEQKLEQTEIRKTELKARLAILTQEPASRKLLREKELQLNTLRGQYTERHPAVMRLREEIRALKESLESGQGDEETSSIEYQTALVELRSIEETEKNVKAALEKDTQDLQELPAIRRELATLEQSRINVMNIYDQLVARFGQSEVSKQMELQDKAVSFRVIDAAAEPSWHTSPARHLIILGGIALGVALAGLWLLGNDLLRGKIHTADDLKRYGVRVLSKLPQLLPDDYLRQQRRRVLAVAATVCLLLVLVGIAFTEFKQMPYMERLLASVRSAIL